MRHGAIICTVDQQMLLGENVSHLSEGLYHNPIFPLAILFCNIRNVGAVQICLVNVYTFGIHTYQTQINTPMWCTDDFTRLMQMIPWAG